MPNAFRRTILAGSIASCLLAAAPSSHAVSETVVAGSDGTWTTNANWTDNTAPAIGSTFNDTRLNVNGLMIYDFAGMTTTFNVSSGGGEARPLGIGSGSNTNGELRVLAGTLAFTFEGTGGLANAAFLAAALDNNGTSTGLLHVNGGNVLFNGSSHLILGARGNAASSGTVIVDAGSLTVDRFDTGTIGGGSTASATITLNNGTINTRTISSTNAASVVTVNLNGGTIATAGPALAGFDLIGSNLDSVNFGGAVKIDTTLGDGRISALAGGAGGIEKLGTGTLTISSALSYTGATTIQGGTLATTTAQTGTTSVSVAGGATFGLTRTAPAATFTTGAFQIGSTSGGILQLSGGASGLHATSALIDAASLSVAAGSAIEISGGAVATGTFALIDYAGAIGGAGFGGLSISFPGAPRATGSLVDNTADGRVDVSIVNQAIKWVGNVSGDWDIDDSTTGATEGTQNWRTETSAVATNYLQGVNGTDTVLFDSTATGPSTINLTTALTPTGVRVDNTAAFGDYTFSGLGSIGGSGNLTKTNTGTLVIANTGANTYSGGTAINGGTVRVGDGVTAGVGSLGTGAVALGGGTLEINRPDGLPIAGAVTGTSGSIALTGGDLTLANAGTDYSGQISLGAGRTLTLAHTATLGGAISGDGTLAINPTGGRTVTLGGDSSFTSPVIVTLNSHLRLTNSGALGDTAQGVANTGSGADTDTDGNGSSIQLSGGITVTGETATIRGSGGAAAGLTAQRGALQSVSGDNTWDGPVTIAGNFTRIGVQDNASLTISGAITDGGAGFGVTFRGGTNAPGTIKLTNTGNQWGTTRIYGSTLVIDGADDILPVTAPLLLGTTGVGSSVLDLNGRNQKVESLGQVGGASGMITNGGTADSTLTIEGTTDASYDGVINDGFTNKVSIVKRGTSRQTLNGFNSYTGDTRVEEGTLAVGASGILFGTREIHVDSGATLDVLAQPGTFPINASQTLSGSGTVSGGIYASFDAIVAPGSGAGNTGALKITNEFNLDFGAKLSLDITGTAPGTGYDQVVVSTGDVNLAGDLGGSKLTFSPVNLVDVFYIILNEGAGAVTGTLGGVAEGGSLFIGAQEFQVSYTSDFGGAGFAVGGTGNDVALLAIPEPGSAAAILAAGSLLLGLRRRRAA